MKIHKYFFYFLLFSFLFLFFANASEFVEKKGFNTAECNLLHDTAEQITCYLNNEDIKNASTIVNKALKENPDNLKINMLAAKVFIRMDSPDKALKHLNQIKKSDPDYPELIYYTGLVYFKKYQYQDALNSFISIIDKNPDHLMAGYYAGMSLYKIKQYRKAAKYLLNAADRNPDIRLNAYYHGAICLQLTGRTSKAIRKFKYVRDHTDSQFLKEYTLKWLEEINKNKITLKPYELLFRLEFIYDDNVRLETYEEEYADEDDFITQAFFMFKYNLIDSCDLKVGAGLNQFQKWHFDLTDFDISANTLNLYSKYKYNNITYGFSYKPHYYWVSNDRYLNRHEFTPEISWSISDSLLTVFSYSYYLDHYFHEGDLNGHSNELSNYLYYFFNNKKTCLFSNIKAEKSSTKDIFKAYEQIKLGIGLRYEIPFDIELEFINKYYRKEFQRKKQFEQNNRKDNKYSMSFSLNRSILYPQIKASFNFQFIKRDSNVEEYDYSKRIIGLSINANY